jgi:large subunit ribosomal protein L19e
MKLQKRLASTVLSCSKKRIAFDESRLEDIKTAITKEDIRTLIRQQAIKKSQKNGTSRVRARKIHAQKKKGRQRGLGSRKGKATARTPSKAQWMIKIRKQRGIIKRLKAKGKIISEDYKKLYGRTKGGFFRSARHLKLYMEEHKLIKNGKK